MSLRPGGIVGSLVPAGARPAGNRIAALGSLALLFNYVTREQLAFSPYAQLRMGLLVGFADCARPRAPERIQRELVEDHPVKVCRQGNVSQARSGGPGERARTGWPLMRRLPLLGRLAPVDAPHAALRPAVEPGIVRRGIAVDRTRTGPRADRRIARLCDVTANRCRASIAVDAAFKGEDVTSPRSSAPLATPSMAGRALPLAVARAAFPRAPISGLYCVLAAGHPPLAKQVRLSHGDTLLIRFRARPECTPVALGIRTSLMLAWPASSGRCRRIP